MTNINDININENDYYNPTSKTNFFEETGLLTFTIFRFIISVVFYLQLNRGSFDQNAGRIHRVRIDNGTFERVEEFKYLGTTLTNQNSIAEEIKNRLRSGNASYNSVENALSSRLLSKNLKIKIYIEI